MSADNFADGNHERFSTPTPMAPESSPFLPRHIVDLFFRPRRFFSAQLALGNYPYLIPVVWCYGISHAIDRIDRYLLQAQTGTPRSGWEHLGPLITESWLGFWISVVALGAISGVMLWFFGGWWYRVRVGWSGHTKADPELARLVYVYSSFVVAAPSVLLCLTYMLFYDNYSQAFAADEPYSAVIMLFPFWSLMVSYRGVRTVFKVSRWKARLWFLILPGVLYAVIFGTVAVGSLLVE